MTFLKLKTAGLRPAQLAVLLAVTLGGCAGQGGTDDDKAGRFLVAPGKFVLYDCGQLATRAGEIVSREWELEALIAKAGPGADGQFVSSVAYRPEYIALHGEMNELRNAAADKKCGFVAGVARPAGTASGAPVR